MTGSGSRGTPAPFRECRIADGEGLDVDDGETGELVVRGPGILIGYYGNAETTREAFFGDWFRTGDQFKRDARGYFSIVGRVKEVIRRSSENIAAREVEMALRTMPGIDDAAVLAVPDDLRKEEVKAYVTLRQGFCRAEVSPAAIIEHAARFLAPYKVPRYLEYRADFPRTASGKIRNAELRAEKPDLRQVSGEPAYWDRCEAGRVGGEDLAAAREVRAGGRLLFLEDDRFESQVVGARVVGEVHLRASNRSFPELRPRPKAQGGRGAACTGMPIRSPDRAQARSAPADRSGLFVGDAGRTECPAGLAWWQ